MGTRVVIFKTLQQFDLTAPRKNLEGLLGQDLSSFLILHNGKRVSLDNFKSKGPLFLFSLEELDTLLLPQIPFLGGEVKIPELPSTFQSEEGRRGFTQSLGRTLHELRRFNENRLEVLNQLSRESALLLDAALFLFSFFNSPARIQEALQLNEEVRVHVSLSLSKEERALSAFLSPDSLDSLQRAKDLISRNAQLLGEAQVVKESSLSQFKLEKLSDNWSTKVLFNLDEITRLPISQQHHFVSEQAAFFRSLNEKVRVAVQKREEAQRFITGKLSPYASLLKGPHSSSFLANLELISQVESQLETHLHVYGISLSEKIFERNYLEGLEAIKGKINSEALDLLPALRHRISIHQKIRSFFPGLTIETLPEIKASISKNDFVQTTPPDEQDFINYLNQLQARGFGGLSQRLKTYYDTAVLPNLNFQKHFLCTPAIKETLKELTKERDQLTQAIPESPPSSTSSPELQQRIGELQKELQKMYQQLRKTQSSLGQEVEQNKQLRRGKEELERRVAELEDHLAGAPPPPIGQSSLSISQGFSVLTSQDNYQDLLEKKTRVELELAEMKRNHVALLSTLEAERAKQKQEAGELLEKLEAKELRVTELVHHSSALKEELRRSKEELKLKEEHFSVLKEELERKDGQCSVLQEELMLKEEESSLLKEELKLKEGQCSALKEDQRLKDGQLMTLQEEVLQLGAENISMETSAKVAEGAVQQLKRELADAEARLKGDVQRLLQEQGKLQEEHSQNLQRLEKRIQEEQRKVQEEQGKVQEERVKAEEVLADNAILRQHLKEEESQRRQNEEVVRQAVKQVHTLFQAQISIGISLSNLSSSPLPPIHYEDLSEERLKEMTASELEGLMKEGKRELPALLDYIHSVLRELLGHHKISVRAPREGNMNLFVKSGKRWHAFHAEPTGPIYELDEESSEALERSKNVIIDGFAICEVIAVINNDHLMSSFSVTARAIPREEFA